MIIDWVTVAAQIVNFLILVWLMKRFLFKPVLNAIEDREKRVAAELANADTKKNEAQQEREEFKRKNDAFDQQRTMLLAKAAEEALHERQRLLDESRQAAEGLKAKMQEILHNEEQNLLQSIRQRTQQEVFAITRKVLMDLAGSCLEERMVEVFIRRLSELTEQEKKLMASPLSTSSSSAVVRTTFELPQAQRSLAEVAIHEAIGSQTQIRFVISPELIGGIELVVNGQKVAWSISDYLASLELSVDELMKERGNPEPKAS